MKVEIRYRWRYKWGGRTVTSRLKQTREQVLREHPEATPVEGTAEEFLVCDQECEVDYVALNGMGAVSPRIFLSRLRRPKKIPQEPDFVPLPNVASAYAVRQDGDLWIVQTMNAELPREIYRGPGPVWVEPTA